MRQVSFKDSRQYTLGQATEDDVNRPPGIPAPRRGAQRHAAFGRYEDKLPRAARGPLTRLSGSSRSYEVLSLCLKRVSYQFARQLLRDPLSRSPRTEPTWAAGTTCLVGPRLLWPLCGLSLSLYLYLSGQGSCSQSSCAWRLVVETPGDTWFDPASRLTQSAFGVKKIFAPGIAFVRALYNIH
jgi:hypothetical protein